MIEGGKIHNETKVIDKACKCGICLNYMHLMENKHELFHFSWKRQIGDEKVIEICTWENPVTTLKTKPF
jgi:hypothetical protein